MRKLYIQNNGQQKKLLSVQSVEKPLSLSKNGVWGVAPRQVAGTPVPVFTPFPGERGQGDRDNKSEVYFKNRLFLQAERTAEKTAVRFLYAVLSVHFGIIGPAEKII